MEYNKYQLKKLNDKKILHKIGKKWEVISVALFMALGGAVMLNHANVNANSNEKNQSNQNNDDTMASNQNPKQLTLTNSAANSNLQKSQSNVVNGANVSKSTKSLYNSIILNNTKATHNSSNVSRTNNNDQNLQNSSSANVSTVTKSYTLSANNTQKFIKTWAVNDPDVYINSLYNHSQLNSNQRALVKNLLNNQDTHKFVNNVIFHLPSNYIKKDLRSTSRVIGSFETLLNSVSYTPSNWPVYKGIVYETLYGDLLPNYRGQIAQNTIKNILNSNIIKTDTKSDIINSLELLTNIMNTINKAVNVMGHDGMSYMTIPNPALMSANNHSTGYTNADPNDQLAFNDDELVDPLFNQNYHYNDPEGASNDIQTILPHYNNGKIDYWDIYYLWNPDSHWFGNQWYHAKTHDFIHFYPGNDSSDPNSVQNVAIPDPEFRFNGSHINSNDPQAGSNSGKSIEVDSNQTNSIPWGEVATGSVIRNNLTNSNGLLKTDQWGHFIEPDAQLAYFATYDDYTNPDNGIYLAYSNDGKQFHPYQSRPVMSTETVGLSNHANFRDPDISTYDHGKRLVAYISGDTKVNQPVIYTLTSSDGITWNNNSQNNVNIYKYLNNSVIDETPHVSILNNQPIMFFGYRQPVTKDEGIAYLLGHLDLDGLFKINNNSTLHYLDRGFDNYAGNISPIDRNNDVYVGWIGNWAYSPLLHYEAYQKGGLHQGTFTLPRVLSWNSYNKQIESSPIEPGNEKTLLTAYLQDSQSPIKLTSNGKVSLGFNGFVNKFNINLSRSTSNRIKVNFDNGKLNIYRTDSINPDMNTHRTINLTGVNQLDRLQFYLDNASIEMYIPENHQFYTILDLDKQNNYPYQVQVDQPVKLVEHTFNTNSPLAIDSGLIKRNKSRFDKYNYIYQNAHIINNQTKNRTAINSICNQIQADFKGATDYENIIDSLNGDNKINVYKTLINDAEYDASENLDQYQNQLNIIDKGQSIINQIPNPNNVFISKQGRIYYLDLKGNLSKNKVISLGSDLAYRFDNSGQSEAFYSPSTNPYISLRLKKSSSDLLNQLVKIVNDKIKGNSTNEQAFDDLLNRVNTTHLPNLETGVAGIPATANVWSTDAQSPFVHQLLRHLGNDFDVLGHNLDVKMLSQIGDLINNSLLKNIWWIGLFAGGPFNFSRVINNLLPNSNFVALRQYKPILQDAQIIYNNPNSISAYNDMLSQFNNLLSENSPVSQNSTMQNIYNDIDVMESTPGLSPKTRSQYQKLSQFNKDTSILNTDYDEINADQSNSSVKLDSAAINQITNDLSSFNHDMNNVDQTLSDENYEDLTSDVQNADNMASNAEQDVFEANSYVDNSLKNSKAYQRMYNTNYTASYDDSVVNSVSNDANQLSNSSMASLIKLAQDDINKAALFIRLDFKNASNPSVVQDAQSEASLANNTTSMVYSMGYSASLSEFYNSPSASSNYSRIYSDDYTLNYDQSLISKISNNRAINYYKNIINSATNMIKHDLKNPISGNVSNANKVSEMASKATSNVYNSYYNSSYSTSTSASYSESFSAIASASYNNWYSDQVSSAYQLYYDKGNQINVDKKWIDSEASQIFNDPQAISAVASDQFLVNSAVQQINHGMISNLNQQIKLLNKRLNIANLAASDAYTNYYNFLHHND